MYKVKFIIDAIDLNNNLINNVLSINVTIKN